MRASLFTVSENNITSKTAILSSRCWKIQCSDSVFKLLLIKSRGAALTSFFAPGCELSDLQYICVSVCVCVCVCVRVSKQHLNIER